MNTEAVVRKGRKFDQVVDGACRVFLRDGFEGASVDEIAREAGVSKATLYSYFPDKRLLFMEVAAAQCRRQAGKVLTEIDMSQPPRIVLDQMGRTFIGFIMSDLGQKIFRISVAESDRFPDLGREFYQSGPAVVRSTLCGYLASAQVRGEVDIDDMDLAADQFAELCKADLWPKLIFRLQETFTEAEISRIVDGAVRTFLARYGT